MLLDLFLSNATKNGDQDMKREGFGGYIVGVSQATRHKGRGFL
jgi:hypothetical protein